MRFAFAGFDRWRTVSGTFVAASWEPVALFTIPVDNQTDFNNEIVERANKLHIRVQLSRIVEADLHRLASQQCDALIVSGYKWCIPDWRVICAMSRTSIRRRYPKGAVLILQSRPFFDGRREWGVSCHQIDNGFDTGALIEAEHFAVAKDEWQETLQLKLQMAAQRLALRVARDFETLWGESHGQEGGSYWPRVPEAARTFDFTRPVAEAMRIVRAFGLIERFGRGMREEASRATRCSVARDARL